MQMHDDDVLRSLLLGLGCTHDTISLVVEEIGQSQQGSKTPNSGSNVSYNNPRVISNALQSLLQMTNSPINSKSDFSLSVRNQDRRQDPLMAALSYNTLNIMQLQSPTHRHTSIPEHESTTENDENGTVNARIEHNFTTLEIENIKCKSPSRLSQQFTKNYNECSSSTNCFCNCFGWSKPKII
jgi:hypothetical protein